ncbi:MAG TPA: glycosyltransferase family 9 protein, partial [Usitatibacter sp.]|nr:glycosyltransferase family 9 protein [Usitatibacter sp.]
MQSFAYERPERIEAALGAHGDGTRFLAGGTNLLDLMKVRVELPVRVIDINRLPLAQLHETRDGGLMIGALVRNSDCAGHPAVRSRYPLLAQALLAGAGITGAFAALAPGSIWGTKRWPGYGALAAGLDAPMVVVGGPEDAPLAEVVAAAAPGRAASAAGALPLRVSAALIERAAVLVTNDSAPLHLATAVGTPVVALFGPTVPSFGFGPRGPRDKIVEHPSLACRPC